MKLRSKKEKGKQEGTADAAGIGFCVTKTRQKNENIK